MFEPSQIRFDPSLSPGDLHFIQGKASAVAAFWPEMPKADRILVMTYDDPFDGGADGLAEGRHVAIHWPKSTWAEGRNFAHTVATGLGDTIDYAFFLDDDVRFSTGDYAGFLRAVHRVKPLLAAPLVPRTRRDRFRIAGAAVQAGAIHDEQLLGFHHSALDDAYVWPLVRDFEDQSWHVACVVQQFMVAHRFPSRLAQFNDFVIENEGHVWSDDDNDDSGYQYEADFEKVRLMAFEYIESRLGRRPPTANDWFRRLPPRSPGELIARMRWRYAGRDAFMRGLRDRDGAPVPLNP